MKKLAFALSLVMALLCVCTACGEEKSGGLSITANNTGTSDTQIVSGLLDDESYTLSNNITKIVSLSPAASMIIDALGASSKLVGVDAVSANYVSAAKTDASGAAALAPEVIFVDAADRDALGSTDIPVFTIPTAESSDAIHKLIRICAKVTGTSADDLSKKLTNAMNAAQLGSSAYSTKFTAYVDLGEGTVGSGTYITEMLFAAGLENVCTAEGFTSMTDDEIIAADPEFIFTVGDVKDYLENSAFAGVRAVKNGYVYSLDEKDICYASNNISNAVASMYGAVSDTRGDE